MLLFNLVIFADTIKHILDALFPNPGLKPSSGLWVINREVMLIVMLCYVMLCYDMFLTTARTLDNIFSFN